MDRDSRVPHPPSLPRCRRARSGETRDRRLHLVFARNRSRKDLRKKLGRDHVVAGNLLQYLRVGLDAEALVCEREPNYGTDITRVGWKLEPFEMRALQE